MATELLSPGNAQPAGTLYGKVAELCTLICGEGTPVPDLQPRSAWTAARGLLGEYSAGTEYRRAERGRDASIVIHQTVLAEPALLTVALAHELLHHWEHLLYNQTELCRGGHPPDVEALRTRLLPDALRQRRWCERHSPRYIAKARSACAHLGVSLETLLFPSSQTGVSRP